MLQPASPIGVHRGRQGGRRVRGWVAGVMAKSLRCTLPVVLQSWDLGMVARRDRAGTVHNRVVSVGTVGHAVLQFVPSPFRRQLRSLSGSPQKSSSWTRAALGNGRIRHRVSDHGCCTSRSGAGSHSDAQPRRAGDEALDGSRRAPGIRVRRHGAGVHRSGDGELPWRGRCFEATACRLPVRLWA